MNKFSLGFLALLYFCRMSLAHEGHGIPGALPPGPHGGVVAELAEVHDHGHGHEEKHAGGKEYFFEATYKDQKIAVYPLTFGSNTSTFVPVSPKTALKNVTVQVEVPRQKRQETLTPALTDEAIEAKFDSKKANRFVILVTANIDGKPRKVKLQIERNK